MKKTNDYDVVIGMRIRLTSEQKLLIKDAYDAKANEERASVVPGRGGLQVHNNTTPANLVRDFGADRLTLSSLLASSERHTIGQLRRWERVLGISLVDKKKLEMAFKEYLANVFED